MTKEEHDALMDIHERIQDIPTKTDLGKAKRTVVKTILTNRKPADELNGPSTAVRIQQIREVKARLYEAYLKNRSLSLNAACQEVWEPLTGGYPTPKSLYEYCHAHEAEF